MTMLPFVRSTFPWNVALPLAALGGSWILAAFFRWLIRRAGRIGWLQGIIVRSGVLAGWIDPSAESVRALFGNFAYWIVLLTGMAVAVSFVNQQAAERLAQLALVHFSNALWGAAVLGTGFWLAGYGSRAVLIATANDGMRFPWRWAAAARFGILFTSVAVASELTGIATLLIRSAYLIVLAGCVLLAVLAMTPVLKGYIMSQASAQPPTFDDHVG